MRKVNERYLYLGDRFTDPELKRKECVAVRRPDGKCIRGHNGNMLVSFDKRPVIVSARLLRRIDHPITETKGEKNRNA
jgi:hypothetical protein